MEWLDRMPRHWASKDDPAVLTFFAAAREADVAALSNLAMCNITLEGRSFHSAEQYFQWKKMVVFGRLDKAEAILKEDKPSKCKRMGGKGGGAAARLTAAELTQWDAESPGVMLAAMRAKFTQCMHSNAALLATGHRVLVEQLPMWGDALWGVKKDGRGCNLCGQLLMHVRSELRLHAEQPTAE